VKSLGLGDLLEKERLSGVGIAIEVEKGDLHPFRQENQQAAQAIPMARAERGRPRRLARGGSRSEATRARSSDASSTQLV